MITLEIVVMPRTNSRNGWQWETYLVNLEEAPNEKSVRLTLIKDGESVSEEFEIKNFSEGSGGPILRTAYTVVSDAFYEFLERHFPKNKNGP